MKLIQMIRPVICLLFVATFYTSYAQTGPVIMTIEDETVTKDDFESIFRKNNRDSATTKESLDEYMELFINFKLKVQEAKELGMDTIQDFIKELDGYRKQLARPYLVDNDLLDELIKIAYERKKTEVRASHLLIKLDPAPTPEDTLKAWNKIMKLRKRITSGEEFEKVARSKAGSQDPSVAQNGGDLGYFTSFQMVYPFEQAAYSLEIGGVSQPVRTRYGYHLIQVTDKRPARGEVEVAHIMVRINEVKNQEEVKSAEKKIGEIYAQIQAGAEFSEMALKYSDDKTTSKKGGTLPWFGTGKMVDEFEEVSFSLKNGEVSEPFQTSYGWHIVKRLNSKAVPPFAEIEKDLKNKVSRDSRADLTKTSFIRKLKEEYSIVNYHKALKPVIDATDTNLYNGIVKVKESDLDKVLMKIADTEYTNRDFVSYLTSRKQNRKQSPGIVVQRKYEEWMDQTIMDYEDARLEEKHDAFRLLMNEYRDGILLFELTDEKVWTKAVKDSSGLEAFYAENMDQFMWPERVEANIYKCANAKIAKQVKKLRKKKQDTQLITTTLNASSELNLQVQNGVFTKEDKEILSKISWKTGFSELIELDGQIFMVEILEVIPPSPKKLDEARGKITAAYQSQLEKEWIEELRNKYKYSVNREVLYSILN